MNIFNVSLRYLWQMLKLESTAKTIPNLKKKIEQYKNQVPLFDVLIIFGEKNRHGKMTSFFYVGRGEGAFMICFAIVFVSRLVIGRFCLYRPIPSHRIPSEILITCGWWSSRAVLLYVVSFYPNIYHNFVCWEGCWARAAKLWGNFCFGFKGCRYSKTARGIRSGHPGDYEWPDNTAVWLWKMRGLVFIGGVRITFHLL